MNHGAVRPFATLLCLSSIGWCQSSRGPTQGPLPSSQTPQQNEQRTVKPPAPNGASQFSADSSTCSPVNDDTAAKAPKNSDPHARPPSSLPATTVPGSTTPCVDAGGAVKSPAGPKQTGPTGGADPTKPAPNHKNNAPSPLDSTNQTNVATLFLAAADRSENRFVDEESSAQKKLNSVALLSGAM